MTDTNEACNDRNLPDRLRDAATTASKRPLMVSSSIMADMREAAETIERIGRERDKAQKLHAEAEGQIECRNAMRAEFAAKLATAEEAGK